MKLFRILCALFLMFSAAAQALEIKPYSAAALAAAQQAHKPFALHFHADGCPVCPINHLNAASVANITTRF